ncbi:MAG: hypothetical protein HY907_15865 [Deltaproteobacteria bacterium]|nr:hypothetical protein [Deltaproteobacteria bacterium]
MRNVLLSATLLLLIRCGGAGSRATRDERPSVSDPGAGSGDDAGATEETYATEAPPDASTFANVGGTVPPPSEAETAAAAAFVEGLIELARRPGAYRELSERIDWPYVEAVKAAQGTAPLDEDAREAWARQLLTTLHLECGRRPLSIAVFARGFAEGYFEPPAAGSSTQPAQADALREAEDALARSLVVSSPCDAALLENGFDVLLRREVDGGPAVRWFRRVEAVVPLRL